jgi:hypothetical protein
LFKKYFTFSGASSAALATAEPCAPNVLASPHALTAQALVTSPVQPPATESNPTDAVQTQLHVRVIALENLVIALLSSATEQQLDCACDMATYISPRKGATQHPLTKQAASEMVGLVGRAIRYRGTLPKQGNAD